MTAYVRVRKVDLLVECIDATGTQVEVAAAAGLSVQRLNQLYTGGHDVIEVRKARRLEEALGVPHGALFTAVDAPLLAPYIRLADDPEDDPDPGEPADTPPAASSVATPPATGAAAVSASAA